MSFVTPLVAMKFEILPNILDEPFSYSTPVGVSLVVDRVYEGCPISLTNRVVLVDLIELNMLDLDIVLVMDWLHSFFASIGCRSRVADFNFQMNPFLSGRKKLKF